MNAGMIWWGQIGRSLRLLATVTDTLRDCRSAVLQVSRELPWRRDFYEAVDMRRTAFSGERRLIRLEWEAGKNPGKFVLDELCSEQVRAYYWPKLSYAEYLGSAEDILLNDYDVWISGIHTQADISRWIEFAAKYEQVAKARDSHAVFILEYDGAPVNVAGLKHIVCNIEAHDCRVFALECANVLQNASLRDYQAEMALSIAGCDPEFCHALLETGTALLRNPVGVASETVHTARSSSGNSFPDLGETQISSAAWEAAIVLLFPKLERFRLAYIDRHKTELARHLPISNSNGERVTDTRDLELGTLCYIAGSEKSFDAAETDTLRFYRKVRNLLAHNKPVPYEDVQRMLTQT